MGRQMKEQRNSHYLPPEGSSPNIRDWDYRTIDQDDRNKFQHGIPKVPQKTTGHSIPNTWYLPRLCRTFAEKILMSSRRQIGSFFIRSSQTKSGYALSLRISHSRVGHFFISISKRNSMTTYKIWNTEFCSLENLVDYFIQMPIYENVKLHVSKAKFTPARTKFASSANTEWELDCSSNQAVTIIATVDRDWFIASHCNTIGLIPRSFVEIEPKRTCTPRISHKTSLTRMDSVGGHDLIQF